MLAATRRNWTEAETRLAMRLYFELPFGKLHQRQTDIIALADLLDRSPSSIAMKLVNFASLDPAIIGSGRSGLANNSRLDRKIWEEFQADWAGMIETFHEAENGTEASNDSAMTSDASFPTSSITAVDSERMALTKLRRGQDFFRRAVLANFDLHCCITGIAEPALLVASHIIPWQSDEQNRLNPRNGLALSATFDRAFDQGLITINENLKVLISNRLLRHDNEPTREMFSKFDGQPIAIPRKLSLDAGAICFHNEWARSTNSYR
ncbi:MAG: HNH endonuclease [Polymorphobacter sp.]